MPRMLDLFPATNPGLRVYGGIRRSDIDGNQDREDFDFSPAIASATGTTNAEAKLDSYLPADDSWITLWDGAASPLLVTDGAFAWGYVRGRGGIWYLEIRNATSSDVIEIQMRSGGIHLFDTGNTYNSAAAAVRAIDRIRARVLTGATATRTDGFLVR